VSSGVLVGLSASVVAVVAIVAAELRDRRRIKHERESRLRDERIGAYRKLLVATSTAHVDREGVEALSQAYAEISLLASTDELDRAAARVWTSYGNTQKIAAKSQNPRNPPRAETSLFVQHLRRAEAARDQFLKLAREDLQVARTRPEDASEG
jgi:hypothetical protein